MVLDHVLRIVMDHHAFTGQGRVFYEFAPMHQVGMPDKDIPLAGKKCLLLRMAFSFLS